MEEDFSLRSDSKNDRLLTKVIDFSLLKSIQTGIELPFIIGIVDVIPPKVGSETGLILRHPQLYNKIWNTIWQKRKKEKKKKKGMYINSYLNILSYRIHHGWRLHVSFSVWITPDTLKLWWRRRIKNQRTWLHMIGTFSKNKRRQSIFISLKSHTYVSKNNSFLYSHKFCFLIAGPSFSFLPWKFICDWK